ncbi:MAG: ribonuclease T2 [Mangrovicoccus sp.]|nr:ribonuclease T2 [Mangrovicoccus sp.]
MRWILAASAICAAFLAIAARAEDVAGRFDYYVLALSWSPNWCAREGDARDAEQCDPARDLGWVLHGLWPQYERGYPKDCPTDQYGPSRHSARAMADIMGADHQAKYQWRKHGRCSGLDGEAYLALSREAYETVNRPKVLRRLDRQVALPASVIEEAFLKANPDLKPDMLTVTCKSGQIAEVRICLSKSLVPRYCGPDAVRDCKMEDALFAPIR